MSVSEHLDSAVGYLEKRDNVNAGMEIAVAGGMIQSGSENADARHIPNGRHPLASAGDLKPDEDPEPLAST